MEYGSEGEGPEQQHIGSRVRSTALSEVLHAPRLGGIAPSAHFLTCRHQLPGWEAHSDLLLLRLCLFAADQVALLDTP